MKLIPCISLILCIMCTALFSNGQDKNSALAKRVSVNITDKPVPEILSLIEKQAGVLFAYPNQVITKNKFTIHEQNATISSLLQQLFPATQFTIKAIGTQIIIKQTAGTSTPVADTAAPHKIIEMNAVVVTALGIGRQQRSLGYAFTDVKGSDLTTARQTNAIQSLSGRVAGLDVNTTNSGVGASVKVTLRGVKVIGGDNQPLYNFTRVCDSSGLPALLRNFFAP